MVPLVWVADFVLIQQALPEQAWRKPRKLSIEKGLLQEWGDEIDPCVIVCQALSCLSLQVNLEPYQLQSTGAVVRALAENIVASSKQPHSQLE